MNRDSLLFLSCVATLVESEFNRHFDPQTRDTSDFCDEQKDAIEQIDKKLDNMTSILNLF